MFRVSVLKMIKTLKINSISSVIPKNTEDTKYINVLTWHPESERNGSKYHVFSPYYLRTDGLETQHNPGNVIFENFWQGSKVWPIVYDMEVWAHALLRGKDQKHLWFKYRCNNSDGFEHLVVDNVLDLEKYHRWKKCVYDCQKPIRYPNGFFRKSEVAFCLLEDKNGNQEKLDYIEARKKIYIKEYGRLIRKFFEFDMLLSYLRDQTKTLVICEIDVPDNEVITLEKLESWVDDKSIRFGHGLCLAWELLKDI